MATLEVCLAILRSAREGRDIALAHQVPARMSAPGTATHPAPLARGGAGRSSRASGQGRDARARARAADAARRARGLVRPLDLPAHPLGGRRPHPARIERGSRRDGADDLLGAQGDGAARLRHAPTGRRRPQEGLRVPHAEGPRAEARAGAARRGGQRRRGARRAQGRHRGDARRPACHHREPRARGCRAGQAHALKRVGTGNDADLRICQADESMAIL